MTNEEAKIIIGNIPIKPEVLDDCYDITEYQEAKAMAIKALEQTEIWNATTKDRQIIAPKGTFRKIWEDEQQPCEDCISREEVKDKLMELWTKYMPMELDMHLSFVLEKISELPSVTPQPTRWIPCNERMPEHNMSVLITVRRYDDEIVVRSGYYYSHGDNSIFHADNGNCWGIDEDGLLAWMPLPQPYKAESEEV